MARKRLLWYLYPSYLIITLVALLLVSWFVTRALRDFHLERTAGDLEARTRLVAPLMAGRFDPLQRPAVDTLCKKLGADTGTRLTVILPAGLVLGDSVEEPGRMDNHADRPEIGAAQAGKVGFSQRYSHTLSKDMLYAALPVSEEGRLAGFVRAALPMTAIDRTLKRVYLKIVLGGVLVAVLAALVSVFVSRRIVRPFEELKQGAERFARGELDRRLAVSGPEEIGRLGEAMNQMALQLDDRMRTVARQGNEREAMLASMVEGVLAVDAEERILRLNEAAARLLGVSAGEAEGRALQEVVRKADLQVFIARALRGRKALEEDIVLGAGEYERHLQAHGTLLRDRRGKEIGVLVVLNDITRLRRLENLRRDFVGNVSHELKTPITAIKGSAETLLEGALDEPTDARRFVEIVAKQADRLNAIIDDLLDLSRVEQGAEHGGVELEAGAVRPVLEAAIQACAMGVQEKDLQVTLFCAPDLQGRVNPLLLEQAVLNLLTNAVKHSEPGGKVVVDASLLDGKVMIKVQDWGSGIAAEHLPRLFERFYRVDKARSRQLGGTGLGLSIVKHIAQVHGGEVLVHSTPGVGSVFTIVLHEA